MSTVSKVVADATARTSAFNLLDIECLEGFQKISNQSYGCTAVDDNGEIRMVEIKAIVRKIDEELDGAELLKLEAEEYANSIKEKEEKKAAAEAKKQAKIKKDKEKRERV